VFLFYFYKDSKPSATIICLSGNDFNVNNNQFSVPEFNECSLSITGNVVNRNQACGLNGTSMSIGFQLTDSRGFINLIDVCYNRKKGSSIYTGHVIQGRTIKNAMKSSTRPSGFKSTEVPSNIAAATSFTKANQLKRFTDIFGSRDKAEEFLNKTYLARGHLTPDGDMIFVSWQWSTYYYINVVPQWQSINNGNWKHIESAVRTKAGQLKSDCYVYTGGHDDLKLNNKKISLEPDGLQVPKWSWKIVKNSASNSGIAFATLNNPFATSANNLCRDICNESGWDWKDRKNYSKGYTICCKVDDLMTAIRGIPEDARVGEIMRK
jgi:DNA/RNA endonuclease G (NUC1)